MSQKPILWWLLMYCKEQAMVTALPEKISDSKSSPTSHQWPLKPNISTLHRLHTNTSSEAMRILSLLYTKQRAQIGNRRNINTPAVFLSLPFESDGYILDSDKLSCFSRVENFWISFYNPGLVLNCSSSCWRYFTRLPSSFEISNFDLIFLLILYRLWTLVWFIKTRMDSWLNPKNIKAQKHSSWFDNVGYFVRRKVITPLKHSSVINNISEINSGFNLLFVISSCLKAS